MKATSLDDHRVAGKYLSVEVLQLMASNGCIVLDGINGEGGSVLIN